MAKAKCGVFSHVVDVGSPKLVGKSIFDAVAQTYTLTGGGKNLWAERDEFHFAALPWHGDGIFTVEANLEGKGVDPHRKWGIMLRDGMAAEAAYADACVHGDGLTSLQYRTDAGKETLQVAAAMTFPEVVQLERSGNEFIMRAAKRGEKLEETGRVVLSFPQDLQMGLFICSHEPTVLETAVFRNFRADVAAAPEVDGEKVLSPSRLEVMEVATGHRRVVYYSKQHFEAPNWSRDGSYLLVNQGGHLYRFNLSTSTYTLLNTGDVAANNNDHGISFDGKLLALSSTTVQAGRKTSSQIYVVPIDGGQPRKVTDDAPSYWHGWSPDGKTLVYCAERNGVYNIWGIPSAGGKEFQLTNSPGLDDGPEYSADGKWIYFNSTRTGRMKIWRMKPDGSGQEQVTKGDDNDWFAHPSADGKVLVYVTYPPTVPAAKHPTNQRVTVRELNLATGHERVLAWLYGGQGTMNVPSWSPDGRFIAFASYTYGDPSL